MTAYAQTVELTEVAGKTTDAILTGGGVYGVFVIILCGYIIYLHRRNDKAIDNHREDAKIRDDKFSAALDRNSAAAEKMASAISDLSRDINRK